MSGIPGSGKTTFVSQLVQKVNENHRKKGATQDIAIAVSMDGYHLPKSALDMMEVGVARFEDYSVQYLTVFRRILKKHTLDVGPTLPLIPMALLVS